MAKLNRLGWAAGIAFRAYGLKLGVRVSDARVLERALTHLPYGWKPSKRPGVDHMFSIIARPPERRAAGVVTHRRLRRYNMLYSEAQQVVRTLDFDEMFEIFESNVRRLVAEFTTQRVFVHAGVVGWRGRAIVIPGRSFTGKTTLVAELVRAGATYYSDEYAVLDMQGRVHPYAKPLSLRESGDYRQTERTVEALGGSAGTKPLRVGCVLVTKYRDGARWAPKTLTAGQTVLSLLANTVSARRAPETALRALHAATTHATAVKGTRGEAAAVTEAILSALEK